MSSTANGRISTISADNRGPLLNIASWICMVAMSIIVVVKLASKVFKVRQLQSDDYFIAASGLIAIVECIVSNTAVSAGLGKHMTDLKKDQIVRLQKALYTVQILYVVALYLARLGVLMLLLLMARDTLRRRIIHSGTIFSAVWVFVMVLVVVFQCSPPRTWAIFTGKCIDKTDFWVVEGIVGILVDVFLTILPAYLLYNVQLPLRKKLSVTGVFLFRLIVIPLIILRLVSIADISSTDDPSHDLFTTALYTQFHLNISIIASCIPFLKPFTDSLQTGLLTSDLGMLTPSNTGYASKFKLRPLGKDSSGGSGASHDKGRWTGGSILDASRTTRIESKRRDRAGEDLGSRGTSEEGLVIKQTTTVAVETHARDEQVGDRVVAP